MRILLIILIFALPFQIFAQVTVQSGPVAITHVAGGINVNFSTITNQASGYLSHTYSISGDIINLSVCYWYNDAPTSTTLDNNFEIPLSENNSTYQLITKLYLSSSQTSCNAVDYSAISTVLFPYLMTTNFDATEDLILSPNPTDGIINFNQNEIQSSKISLFDNFGKFLKELPAKRLEISDLNDGIYFIVFENEKGCSTKKVILRK